MTWWYLTTFRRLHDSRQIGATLSPISMTDYYSYFKMFEMIDEVEIVIVVLQALDTRYINFINQRRAAS
jgi:hypothetical protein